MPREREQGIMYVRAIGEFPEITGSSAECLADPNCTGFETSKDGKLSWLRIPAHIRTLRVESGLALRVPSSLGTRLSSGKQFVVITPDEFYSRGSEPPDGYALEEQVAELKKNLREASKASPQKKVRKKATS